MGQSEIVLASSFATVAVLFAVLYSAARGSRTKLLVNADPATGAEARERNSRTRTRFVLPIAAVEARLHKLACDVEIALPQRMRRIDQRIDEADREIARLCRQISPESHGTVEAAHRVPDFLTIDAPFQPNGTMPPRRSQAASVEQSIGRRIRRAA